MKIGHRKFRFYAATFALGLSSCSNPESPLRYEPASSSISPDENAAFETVSIMPGDTLGKIASRYCLSLDELMGINPEIEEPDVIYPGQKVEVINYCLDTQDTVESASRDERIAQFISTYRASFASIAEAYNLNADVMLAQAILESGYGSSDLATNANNFFGMKAKQDWAGLTYTKLTEEVIPKDDLLDYEGIIRVREYPEDQSLVVITFPDVFMAFHTPEEGIKEYAKTIIDRFPYAVGAKTEEEYVDALLNGIYGPYATDPEYRNKILGLVEDIKRVELGANLPQPIPTTTINENSPGVDDRQKQIDIINNLELTPEGYYEFVGTIIDYTNQADQYPAYNMPIADVPENRKISSQPGMAFVTLHYTAANYRDIDNFLESTNNSPSDSPNATDTCCGVNFFIDKDGNTYQLGTLEERMRTNPPFDAATIGIEVEALTQDDITAKQNLAVAYLTTYILISTGNGSTGILGDTIYGHAETRSLPGETLRSWCEILIVAGYNEDNLNRCKSTGAVRTDWPTALVDPMRAKVYALLLQI